MSKQEKGHHKRMKLPRSFGGYVYIMPWLIGTLAFFAYPLYKTIAISLSRITEIVGMKLEFIGLENYVKIFSSNATFIPNFIGTVKDTFIDIPLILVFALFVSILANKDIKMKGFFRGIFILPFLLGTGVVFANVVGINVADGVTSVSNGILIPEPVLVYLGAKFSEFIQMFLDKITIIILKSPIQIIVFLGALQTIPAASYESAKCDGATEWEMFWKITLPSIIPQILFNTVFTMVETFTDTSNPVISSIMDAWFGNWTSNMNYGFTRDYAYIAAMGWVYLLFIVIMVCLVFLVFRRTNRDRDIM
jgi:ABC-type sugar transport system permease subunit